MLVIILIVVLVIIGLIPEKESSKNKRDEFTFNKYSNFDTTSAFYDNEGFGENTLLKRFLIEEKGPFCEDCGQETKLQVDHIIPISRGGTNDMENLQLLCYKCHQKKHNYKFFEVGDNKQLVIGKYKKIRDAIDQGRKLQIKYQAYNGNITVRIILPIKIISEKGKYYLEAYCDSRKENRIFKISRIQKISFPKNER